MGWFSVNRDIGSARSLYSGMAAAGISPERMSPQHWGNATRAKKALEMLNGKTLDEPVQDR